MFQLAAFSPMILSCYTLFSTNKGITPKILLLWKKENVM